MPSGYTEKTDIGTFADKPIEHGFHFTGMKGTSGITGTPTRGVLTIGGLFTIYCPTDAHSGDVRGSFMYLTND